MNKSLAVLALAIAPALALGGCNGSSGRAAPASLRFQTRARPSRSTGAEFTASTTVPRISTPAARRSPPSRTTSPSSRRERLTNRKPHRAAARCSIASVRGARSTTASRAAASAETSSSQTTERRRQACAPLGATPTGFGGRQDPLDFVGSDVALKSTEYATYKHEPRSGQRAMGRAVRVPDHRRSDRLRFQPRRLQRRLAADQALGMVVLRDRERHDQRLERRRHHEG